MNTPGNTSTPAAMQGLLDRAAIHDLHMRYFHACDSGDRILVRGCFTDDVRAHFEGREPVTGVDALIAQMAVFENLHSGACRIATHFAGNLQYGDMTADDAQTVMNVFACLVNADGTSVAVRSLRYLDQLRRVQGQWKIAVRFHTLDWSSDVPCTFARMFAQKPTRIPDYLLRT
jgi:hypothetical protein